MKTRAWMRRADDSRGQSLMEFALVLPFLLLVGLGTIEVGYAMLDQHVVTKTTREGSNLISRNVTLQDARVALTSLSTPPIDFADHSRVILTVLKKGATAGTANFDEIFVYQRHEFGALVASSKLGMAGAGVFGPAPNYVAVNADTNAGLQVEDLPANINIPRGGFLYVTEIFTTHELITPLSEFGVTLPETLYSIAYF
jgi:hypothetical protein